MAGRWKLLLLAVALALPHTAKCQEVAFSQPGGFYADSFSLTLQGPEPYTIRYTLNGNTPTANDPAYTSAIPLTRQCLSPSAIYRVQNAPDDRWYMPDSVERIIVVRAALFDDAGVRRSPVATHSYVISSLLGRNIELPVVSLCVDSVDLFGYDSGIFVPGRLFDPDDPLATGNYYQRGSDWERRASFEFYSAADSLWLVQDCGVRTHGNSTRNVSQKGLSLYARADYGTKRFNCRFFGTADRYKRLLLRSFRNSWMESGVEDWLAQNIAEPLLCDRLATRPVALFLNGEYWGIYFLGEKPDEHYVEEHYGIESDEVDMIVNWGEEVENGTPDRWNAFMDSLRVMENEGVDCGWLASQVDLAAITDYLLLELFTINKDWPANNVRCYTSEGQLWRWLFFDGDGTFVTPSFDVIANITCDDTSWTWPTSEQSTLLFRTLLKCDGFRNGMMQRLKTLANSHFSDSRTKRLLDSIVGLIAPEVPHQKNRFNVPANDWNQNINLLRSHLNNRAKRLISDYRQFCMYYSVASDTATLYPNPSAGSTTLVIKMAGGNEREVTVCNMKGQCVYRTTCVPRSGYGVVTLPKMVAGVYVVRAGRMKLKWVVI